MLPGSVTLRLVVCAVTGKVHRVEWSGRGGWACEVKVRVRKSACSSAVHIPTGPGASGPGNLSGWRMTACRAAARPSGLPAARTRPGAEPIPAEGHRQTSRAWAYEASIAREAFGSRLSERGLIPGLGLRCMRSDGLSDQRRTVSNAGDS